MVVRITKGRVWSPITKYALMLSLAILFYLVHLLSVDSSHPSQEKSAGVNVAKSYEFPIRRGASENVWSSALAEHLGATQEVMVKRGRVDVLSSDLAIEVDFLKKWHEGLGQAWHYGYVSDRQGVVALIIDFPKESTEQDRELISLAVSVIEASGLRALLLYRKVELDDH